MQLNKLGLRIAIFFALAVISDFGFATPIDPPVTDKSLEYARYIFGDAVDLLFGGVGPSTPDSILGAMSVILNVGCLLFAGIIIGYTALAGILNTAHEGNVMGKAYNTMWIPLRTTFAIALLLPMSSGFSVMQLGVLWFAGKGVGLADSTWNAAIDHMDTTGTLYPPRKKFNGEHLAKEFLLRAACLEIVNRTKGDTVVYREPESAQNQNSYYLIQRYTGNGNSLLSLTTTNAFVAGVTPFFSLAMPHNVCGTVKLEFYRPDENHISFDAAITYQQRHKEAFEQLENTMYGLARNLINNDGYTPTGDEVRLAVNIYNSSVEQAISEAVQTVTDDRNAETGWVNESKQNGWITAGAWYMTIMRLNQATFDLINVNPVFTDPDLQELAVLGDYDRLMSDRINTYLENRLVETRYGTLESARIAEAIGTDGEDNDGWSLLGGGLNWLTNQVLEYEDPLMGMQNLGHGIINTAIAAVTAASLAKGTTKALEKVTGEGITGGVTDVLTGGTAKAAATVLSSMTSDALMAISALALMLIGIGFMLAFYLPTMPFVLWMLGVAGWFVLVIEAVVAAPIWAAAHSIPEGEGAIGQHARAGYMIILSLFLRPTLMLFGLFGSMILMIVMGRLISIAFMPAMTAINSGHTMGLITVIAFLIIFTGLMISIAHRAFGLIHEIPDKVLRYIGGMSETLGEAGNEQSNRTMFIAGAARLNQVASGVAHQQKSPGKPASTSHLQSQLSTGTISKADSKN